MPQTQKSDWRVILRENFTQVEKLADFLELNSEQKKQLSLFPRFILNVPRRLAMKMAKGTLDDPLLRQFLPLKEENALSDSFILDPVGDAYFRKGPKLLHKYTGRALLVCTSACAMHCRYCFRQNFDYAVDKKGYEDEIEALRQDTSIHEVILSGGDPLSLPDTTLDALLKALSEIPHIRRVRFHSRFPIGIPERINDAFINMLKRYPFAYWFVIHANLAKELDDDVIFALKQLAKMSIPILNQAVLLQGVNDTVLAQKELCERLVDNGFFPYYLHQLDKVQGCAHFEVLEEKGRFIIAELRKILPGYAIPSYVKEICGQMSKTPLN